MAKLIEPTEKEVAQRSATLKPCPFCGSPCELEWTPVPDFSAAKAPPKELAWHVVCTSVGTRCPMGKHWLSSTWSAAVMAWNQRA